MATKKLVLGFKSFTEALKFVKDHHFGYHKPYDAGLTGMGDTRAGIHYILLDENPKPGVLNQIPLLRVVLTYKKTPYLVYYDDKIVVPSTVANKASKMLHKRANQALSVLPFNVEVFVGMQGVVLSLKDMGPHITMTNTSVIAFTYSGGLIKPALSLSAY